MTPHASVGRKYAADDRANPSPAMFDVEAVAGMLGVSTRHVRRLVDAGKCPQPVRLGRVCRWPRPAIESWIADGCPKCRRAGGAK